MVYETKIKSIGSMSGTFAHTQLLIIFGDNVPLEIKEYCYNVEVAPLEEEIKPGMSVFFDDEEYKITAVGEIAQRTLRDLGHCTFNFNGAKEAELPGTIYLENKELPFIDVGSSITIK